MTKNKIDNSINDDKKSSYSSKTFASSNTTKAKRITQKLSTKSIAIISAVVGVVLIVAIVLMVLFIPRKSEEETPEFARQVYYYALSSDDENGLALDRQWMMGCDLDIFTKEFANGKDKVITVDDNLIIRPCSAVSEDDETTLYFKYKNQAIAIFYIEIVDGASKVSNVSDLRGIPANTTSSYILTNDVENVGSISIKNFKGRFYGNHHTISGLNMNYSGGLFDYCENAGIYSLNVIAEDSQIDSTKISTFGLGKNNDLNSLGIIANSAYSTDIKYCSVEGKYSVSSDDNSSALYVGGIIGYLNDAEKRTDNDGLVNYLRQCTAVIDITLTTEYDNDSGAKNDVCVGSIVGLINNATVTDCSGAGAIYITSSNSEGTYVGGLVGRIQKDKKGFVENKLHYFDGGNNMLSKVNIDVTTIGNNSVFVTSVGGVFGRVINYNLNKVTYEGSMRINGSVTTQIVGGIVGIMESNVESVKINMNLTDAKMSGNISVLAPEGSGYEKLIGYVPEECKSYITIKEISEE